MESIESMESLESSLILKERIDVEKLRILCETNKKIKYGNERIWDYKLGMLRKYRKGVKGGNVEIEYEKKRGKYGRLYGLGLQMMWRPIRNTLARDYYYDIDIKNAFYTFLKQYCEKNEIVSYELNNYVEKRDEKLNEIIKSCGCSREKAKELTIKIIFLGKLELEGIETEKIPKWMERLRMELITICEHIYNRNKSSKMMKDFEKNYKKDLTKYKCKKTSFLSLFLETIENKTIMRVKEEFEKRGYTVGALIFDGLLIDKKDVLNELILEDINKEVNKESEYKIKLEIKEMNEIINTEELKDDRLELNEEYVEWKKEFEKNHFRCGHTYYEEEINDEGEIKLKVKTRKNLEIELSNCKKINVDGKYKKCGEIWLQDEFHRSYSKIVFKLTDKKEENEYNLFNGFKAENLEIDTSELTEEEKLEKIKDILELIKLLAGDTEEGYIYLLSYIANIIQLRERSIIAIVLRDACDPLGRSGGVGKNTLLDFIRDEIIGTKYFLETTDPKQIYEKFNSFLMGKCLVHVPEADAISNKENWSKFKSIVSQKILQIEGKGKEMIEVENSLNIIMTTNSNDIVFNDRRVCVFDCSKKRKNDIIYWNNLHKSLKDKETIKIFYKYLKNYKVKLKTPAEWEMGCPRTIVKEELEEFSIPQLTKYLIDFCYKHKENKKYEIKLGEEYNKYKEWALVYGFKLMSLRSFGMEMTKWISNTETSDIIFKKYKNNGLYVINRELLYNYLIENKLIVEEDLMIDLGPKVNTDEF
jgi:hypothetical protein